MLLKSDQPKPGEPYYIIANPHGFMIKNLCYLASVESAVLNVCYTKRIDAALRFRTLERAKEYIDIHMLSASALMVKKNVD